MKEIVQISSKGVTAMDALLVRSVAQYQKLLGLSHKAGLYNVNFTCKM